MFVDNFIPSPGHGYPGNVIDNIAERSFDLGLRRPYLDSRGRPCVTINTGRWTTERGQRVPLREKCAIVDVVNSGMLDGNALRIVMNATALRKEEWIQLDQVVLREARFRLRAWTDLSNANSY